MVEFRISGVTHPDEATAAVAGGASVLAIPMAKPGSARGVSLAVAGRIVAAAGRVPVIGVPGPSSMVQVLHFGREAGLAGIQLAATAPRDLARRIREAGFALWRAVRVLEEEDLGWLPAAREGASVVLVESGAGPILGSGVLSLPLSLAREARAQLPGFQMALAGCLAAGDLAAVIGAVRPDIVDLRLPAPGASGHPDLESHLASMEAVVGQFTAPRR